MTVILVLATFLAFILVDSALSRRKARQQSLATVGDPVAELQRESALPAYAGEYVDGFRVPRNVRYHPGHGWALRERRNVIRVGVDDFAAKLAGRIEKIELPKAGHWLRQGQKAIAVFRNGEKAELVSPVEGEVVEINPEVVADPSLLRTDPYGRGWLMTVFAPDEDTTCRNLMPPNLVAGWMRNTVARLYSLQPQFAGAVAADGGLPVDDLCSAIPGADWRQVTEEFFL